MPETEVILFARNGQKLIGYLIKAIHRPKRIRKKDGQECPSRGPDFTTLFNILRNLHPNVGISLAAIKANGNELAIQLVCGTESIIVAFHLALGAAFQICDKSDLKRYPFANYNKGAKHIQRTHLIFEFIDQDKIWVLLDCSAFKNMARWRIYRSNWHPAVWIGGPDPINYFTAWSMYMLAWMKVHWYESDVQNWTVARFLTHKKLWNGVGAYNLSEVCNLLAHHHKIYPWNTLGESFSIQLDTERVPDFILIIAAVFRLYHHETSRYWHKFNLKTHPKEALHTFAMHQLQVYRKPWSHYYTFRGVGRKHHIYLQPQYYPKNIQDISTLTPVFEKWLLGAQPKVWKLTDLGVGPLSWHSKTDIMILENANKYEQYLDIPDLGTVDLSPAEEDDGDDDSINNNNQDTNTDPDEDEYEDIPFELNDESQNQLQEQPNNPKRTREELENEVELLMKKKRSKTARSPAKLNKKRPGPKQRFKLNFEERLNREREELTKKLTQPCEALFQATGKPPKTLNTTEQLATYFQ